MSELIEALSAAGDLSPEVAVVGGGTWAITKLLGPSLGAIGTALGDFTDYRVRNILRIGEKAAKRLQAEADPEADRGTVHPRVAQAVLEQGSWIDDDLHQEYLAGLLVGARTKDGASDAQAYLARIISALTAEQTQLHYLVYRAYAGYWPEAEQTCPMPWTDKNRYREHAVVVDRAEAMRFSSAPWFGLMREGLIADAGNPDLASGTEFGFVPSRLGAETFIAVFAAGSPNPDVLCLSDERRERIAALAPSAHMSFPHPAPRPLKAVIRAI